MTLMVQDAPPRPWAVYAACATSFLLGVFFIFVWSPLPWGWQGIDFYSDFAQRLARGEPFPVVHIPWGYAYFLAPWYRLFGDRAWVPLLVQAALNTATPWLLYRLVRQEIGRRTAIVASVLAGLLSFNTIYTSTQASDAVCTPLFLAAVLCLAIARARQQLRWFALAGVLAGLSFQFRPNLILFPLFAAAVLVAFAPRRRTLLQLATFLAAVGIVAAPWIVRNYRWSGQFIPATTHGGIQLWFGSLQTGQYQSNWFYNPRALFESPPLDYSSIDGLPVVVTGLAICGTTTRAELQFVYWTHHDGTVQRVPVPVDAQGRFSLELPAMPAPTEVAYYFDATFETSAGRERLLAPPAGEQAPAIFVISTDHLGDLDVAGWVLDVFDLARLAASLAWHDGTVDPARTDLDHDGDVTAADLAIAAAVLADRRDRPPAQAPPALSQFDYDAERATLTLADGGALIVPRGFAGPITALEARGELARAIVSQSRSFARLSKAGVTLPGPVGPGPSHGCLEQLGINAVAYRRQPHEMRRYTALALDNIRANPGAYAWSTLRRAVRLFIIEGSDDRRTAMQFQHSSAVYWLAHGVTATYAALFAAGLVVAVRRRLPILMLLMPIVYVPATISFVLINARYSMTTQPFMFAFMAILLVSAADTWSGRTAPER